ncbi:MAG: ABC transporter permease [Gemmatimonadetes bacterium]|nr:ABC transporter permease [Gemmatimonadota bacterium]
MMTWRWAIRDLLRHPTRSALSLLGVAVAAALLLDMVMLSGGIERSFGELLRSRGYQLRISPLGTLPFDTEATLGDVTTLTAALRRDTTVREVAPVLGTTMQGSHDESSASLVTYGITPTSQGIYALESGEDLGVDDSLGILLGAPAAARLGAIVGDTIVMRGRLDPQMANAGAERRFVVRGMVRFLYDARDQPSVAVALAAAQRLGGPEITDRASVLMVRVDEASDLTLVTARLRVAHVEVAVNSIDDLVAQFRLRLTYFRQLSLILGSISLVVTVLLVGTLLAITVNERSGEIATLRAIGVAREHVALQVVVQGLLLTVLGGAAGMVLGLGTARWLDAILTSFPGLPAAISFFVAEPAPLAIAAATLLVTGVLAGLPSAWRAASTPIAAALRSDAP